MRQHEAVVQAVSPGNQLLPVRLSPELRDQRPHQELLGQAHARVRRHFEGAQLEQAEPRSGAVWRIELVDAEFGAMGAARHIGEKMAEEAIRHARGGRGRTLVGDLVEGNLQFVERLHPPFVDPGMLAGGADEQPGEQIGKRRMVLPVFDHAAQQIGTPQKGTVIRSGSANHQVVAAAGPGVLPIEHELLGAQAALARQFVERGGVFDQCVPAGRGLDVHFDHAWIGSHFKDGDTGIVGRGITFDQHRHGEMSGGIFDGGDQIEIVRQVVDGRHEDIELALARLHAERGPGQR